MSIQKLVNKVSKQQDGLYPQDIKKMLKTILGEISNGLENGKRVELRSFGTFSLRFRNARQARNPRTGESVAVDENYTVIFKPSKELKDRINAD